MRGRRAVSHLLGHRTTRGVPFSLPKAPSWRDGHSRALASRRGGASHGPLSPRTPSGAGVLRDPEHPVVSVMGWAWAFVGRDGDGVFHAEVPGASLSKAGSPTRPLLPFQKLGSAYCVPGAG